jgi:hypothetical protein
MIASYFCGAMFLEDEERGVEVVRLVKERFATLARRHRCGDVPEAALLCISTKPRFK